MGEMILLVKEFEVGTDQINPDAMRAIARDKIAEWTKELWAEGYRNIEQGVDLEILPPEDMDPRYVTFRATLTASKNG
jgi:hypothetical protein